MAGYVYRGTDFDTPRKGPGGRPATGLTPFNPDKCGTNAGYHQHLRHDQDACTGCHEAHKAYDAEYRAKKKAAGITRKRN